MNIETMSVSAIAIIIVCGLIIFGVLISTQNKTRHDELVALLKGIMNQAELAAGLKTIQTQVGKVAKEQSDRFDVLTKEIADLKAAIEAGDVKPEVASALADVKTALQSLDDTIPDAP